MKLQYKIILTIIMFFIATPTKVHAYLSEYKYGCQVRCPGGTCKIVGQPGTCECDSLGQPRCKELNDTTKLILSIEDEDGTIIANDEASIIKFFEMLNEQSQNKVTVEKGK